MPALRAEVAGGGGCCGSGCGPETLATTGGREPRARPGAGVPGAGESNDGRLLTDGVARGADAAAGGGCAEGSDFSSIRLRADDERSALALASRSNASLASMRPGVDGRALGADDGRSGGTDPRCSLLPAILRRTRRRPWWDGGRPESLLDMCFPARAGGRAPSREDSLLVARLLLYASSTGRLRSPSIRQAFTQTPARREHSRRWSGASSGAGSGVGVAVSFASVALRLRWASGCWR